MLRKRSKQRSITGAGGAVPADEALTRKALDRRAALKGFGVLAVAGSGLVSCAENSATGGSGGSGSGSGGSGSGGVTSSGGSSSSSGGATGSGGVTSSGGSSSGGATGSGGVTSSGGSSSSSGGATGSGGGSSSGGTSGSGGAATGGNGAGGTGAGGRAAGGATGSGGATGAGGSGGATGFDDVATCTLTATDGAGEGPFFIHDTEVMGDTDLNRSDLRETQEGIELQLNLRVLDMDGMCKTPIKGAQVYIWHTNATGFYSGFANQDPNMSYMGAAERTVENMDRFCRGFQLTDDNGVVAFRTIYPGWYNGRNIHIHFVALHPGSNAMTSGTGSYRDKQYMIFTTQMYFEEAFSRNIHEHNAPYMSRASGTNYNNYVKPNASSKVRPTATMNGNVAVGYLNIITSGMGSRR